MNRQQVAAPLLLQQSIFAFYHKRPIVIGSKKFKGVICQPNALPALLG